MTSPPTIAVVLASSEGRDASLFTAAAELPNYRVVIITPRGSSSSPWPEDVDRLVLPAWNLTSHTSQWLVGLEGIINRLDADLIHVHNEPWAWTAFRVCRTGRPFVIHSAESVIAQAPVPYRFRRLGYRRVLRRASGHVTWGATGLSEWARVAPSSAPSAIICGSPPPENVFLPVPWERHPGPLRLLFVGRLIEQKGVLDLIEAVRLLNARTPRVSLTVMGKGPASRDIRAAVAAAELGTQVRLVPWGQGPDVHSQMAQSDLLVVPSKPTAQNREQWGRVVVEAMMTGRPTLVSDCGELPQMVPDTSWTFQAGDALDLARRIESIIDSNDWLPRNSSLALTWGERFTPTSQVRVLDRFWQDVLSSRG